MPDTSALDGHSLITPTSIDNELSGKSAVRQDDVEDHKSLLKSKLDVAAEQFRSGEYPGKVGAWVTLYLHDVRKSLDTDTWRALIPFVQEHPVSKFFLEDPLTRWSWDKPRGYSGDAHLLDLIYRHEKVLHQVEAASDLGKALFEFTSTSPSSLANWDRRDILARHADEIAAKKGEDISVLSFAAGHLREAAVSQAFKEGRISRWTAVDQDPISMAEVKASYTDTCVQSSTGSIRDLLGKRLDLEQHDFVYSSGLYDYLTDKVAVKTTTRLLELVKPGGTFLFANYSYPIIVDAYLETFMNWTLLLRSEEDMWRIINESGNPDEWDSHVFFGHERNIAYGVMRRKS